MNRRAAEIEWVVLTQGDRDDALVRAVASIAPAGHPCVTVVLNGAETSSVSTVGADIIRSARNLGVPGGRDLGVRSTTAPLVGFLDDDAELRAPTARIVDAFDGDPELGAVSLRLVDEQRTTARRHVPRTGRGEPAASGEVAYFLGGACAIRRDAYEQVGGYFTKLFYGHEEIELSWRLIDAGWKIRYLADVEVFHPRTEISRHADGWRLTGRNRVWIARRTLPWPVAGIHVLAWLVLGTVRAPKGDCRRSYLAGWWSGWSGNIDRRPIRWTTVVRLTRLGRPPVI